MSLIWQQMKAREKCREESSCEGLEHLPDKAGRFPQVREELVGGMHLS